MNSTMALRSPLVVLLESNSLHAMPRQSCRPSSVDGHRLIEVLCTPFTWGDLVFRGYSRKFEIQLKFDNGASFATGNASKKQFSHKVPMVDLWSSSCR